MKNIKEPRYSNTITNQATNSDKPKLSSSVLFGSRNEIVIVHNDEEYRLRITRAGKLILTK
ncbi:MAG: hemin uptake protein HemP [Methylomicrobium sp.]